VQTDLGYLTENFLNMKFNLFAVALASMLATSAAAPAEESKAMGGNTCAWLGRKYSSEY
jgi:hypothetical protein